MALTIKMLKDLGIEQDAIEAIVKAHGDTVDALKDALKEEIAED